MERTITLSTRDINRLRELIARRIPDVEKDRDTYADQDSVQPYLDHLKQLDEILDDALFTKIPAIKTTSSVQYIIVRRYPTGRVMYLTPAFTWSRKRRDVQIYNVAEHAHADAERIDPVLSSTTMVEVA